MSPAVVCAVHGVELVPDYAPGHLFCPKCEAEHEKSTGTGTGDLADKLRKHWDIDEASNEVRRVIWLDLCAVVDDYEEMLILHGGHSPAMVALARRMDEENL